MPETGSIAVDALINLPLDDGSALPLRQTIHAQPTETPGLVVFPVLLGALTVDEHWWTVTHVASGKRIPISFRTPEAATAFANAAGRLTDWTAKSPQVQKQEALALAFEHGGHTDEQYMASRRNAVASAV